MPFTHSTVALRLAGDGDQTFGQLLDAASKVATGAFAHGAVPFPRVVDALSLARTASYTPVYQVGLVASPSCWFVHTAAGLS